MQNSAPGLTKQVNEAGTSYNPIYDAQGDVIGLLNSAGALVQSVCYGPYGENTTASGSASYSATNDAFLFQGGYHLAGGNAGAGNVPNNLYHYGARYYDPSTGRWTQPDPASGTTAFAFAGDDPINNVDPSGELTLPSWFGSLLKHATGVSILCATSEFIRWIRTHENAYYNLHKGPSLGEGLHFLFDCS